MFFDQLIKELAICLNTGEKSLNRLLFMPVYKNHSANANVYQDNEYYQQVSRDSGCLWTPLKECLSSKVLNALDNMLGNAPDDLIRCNSRSKIQNYIMKYTDLVDCHFESMNYMQSINRP